MGTKSDAISELRKLENVGTARATKMYENGVSSIDEVVLINADELATMIGSNTEVAENIIESAIELNAEVVTDEIDWAAEGRAQDREDSEIPKMPDLPPMPSAAPPVVVPESAKMRLMEQKGPLYDVRTCMKCFAIKVYPNPDIARKRRRGEPLEQALTPSFITCFCNIRGSYGLTHKPAQWREKIVANPDNDIIFALFYKG